VFLNAFQPKNEHADKHVLSMMHRILRKKGVGAIDSENSEKNLLETARVVHVLRESHVHVSRLNRKKGKEGL
jgi:hypothetical protein